VKEGKVRPLSDEDRRTLVRWIDLGCPIDFDYKLDSPERGYGWMLDDNRPVLAVTYPQAGKNAKVDRIVIGAHDYGTGIEDGSLTVTADFAIDDVAPGENLAGKFKANDAGVWELKLAKPLANLARGNLTVSVADGQGNTTKIVRTFAVD
jgi:hypothetical protein